MKNTYYRDIDLKRYHFHRCTKIRAEHENSSKTTISCTEGNNYGNMLIVVVTEDLGVGCWQQRLWNPTPAALCWCHPCERSLQ